MIKVTGLSKNTVYSVGKSLKEKDILYQGEIVQIDNGLLILVVLSWTKT